MLKGTSHEEFVACRLVLILTGALLLALFMVLLL
jgi:hypothetical protein